MRIGTRTPIGNVDGFGVVTPGSWIGWVEEMWLDDEGAPTAMAVRLPSGRRGLLLRDGIDEIHPDRREIAVRSDARLLELEPPHLDTGTYGTPTASWTTTGSALALPGLRPPAAAAAQAASSSEPSFFTTVSVLYGALFVIGCALTGVCFLVPYLVSGRPF
jgi:hypothetical protein